MEEGENDATTSNAPAAATIQRAPTQAKRSLAMVQETKANSKAWPRMWRTHRRSVSLHGLFTCLSLDGTTYANCSWLTSDSNNSHSYSDISSNASTAVKANTSSDDRNMEAGSTYVVAMAINDTGRSKYQCRSLR